MNEERQRRIILVVTAVGFALVSVLATFAFVSHGRAEESAKAAAAAETRVAELERQAKTAADRARRARSQAGELIGFFTEGLREEMATIGRTDLLEASARRAEAYFEALPPADTDADSDFNYARMLLLRGWAHHSQGALPESVEAIDRAIAVLEPHAAAEGAPLRHIYYFLQMLNESTLPLEQLGRYEEAKERLGRALEVVDAAAVDRPDDVDLIQPRAASLFQLGAIAFKQEDYPGSVELYDQAIAEIERASELEPDDVNFLALRSIAYGNKSMSLLSMEEFDAAEVANRTGASVTERMIEMQPGRKKWRKEYATQLNNYGTLLADLGETERAREFFDRSRAMRKELIAFDPANVAWRSDLANSERNAAIQHLREGDLVAASASATTSLNHWGVVLRSDPNNPDWHARLKDAVRTISRMMRENDGLTESAKLYEGAARLFAELAELDEGREQNLRRQAEVLSIAAERRAETDDFDSALAHAEKSFAIRLGLHKASPDDADLRYELGDALSALAFAERSRGSRSNALRYFQFAYAVISDLPEDYERRPLRLAFFADRIRDLKTDLGSIPLAELVFPLGSEWRFLDIGQAAPEGWTGADFDDAAWKVGGGQFGYGDGDELTAVGYGGDPDNKWMTTYFRRAFDLDDPAAVRSLHLELVRDDGAVVYLNGEEIARTMMPEGPVTYETPATDFTENDVENVPEKIDPLDAHALLKPGRNVFAVEIHQVDAQSSDLSFDLQLRINAPFVDPLEGMDTAALAEMLGAPAKP